MRLDATSRTLESSPRAGRMSQRILAPNYLMVWSTAHFIYPQVGGCSAVVWCGEASCPPAAAARPSRGGRPPPFEQRAWQAARSKPQSRRAAGPPLQLGTRQRPPRVRCLQLGRCLPSLGSLAQWLSWLQEEKKPRYTILQNTFRKPNKVRFKNQTYFLLGERESYHILTLNQSELKKKVHICNI